MKDKLPLILTLVFALGSAIVAYQLYNKVITEADFQEEIVNQELAIKNKLSFYSTIQKIHYKQVNKYLGEWNDFRKYIDTGKIVITQRNEETRELYFGKDTTIITFDTIKITSIKDSILNKTNYELRTLEYVPDENNARTFDLYTGFAKGRAVFEIRDSEPINPRRLVGELDTLMIGSKFEPTTEGNWH